MSKFDKIFSAREDQQANLTGSEKEPLKESEKRKEGQRADSVRKKAPSSVSAQKQTVSEPGRGRGRPPAKRSDPDFIGFTTYIRKETHRQVKIALLRDGDGTKELSELVEELLFKWVKDK